MASLTLLRHATLLVEYADTTLLVDPMLDEAGAVPPIQNSPNDRRNPFVDLPVGVDRDAPAFDALLVTHLHNDHLDDTAKARLPGHAGPTLCQPEDADQLRETGFEDVQPIESSLELGDVTVTRTPARHGHGQLAEQMAPVSGFVFEAPDEPTLYHAGDTVWYEGVADTLDRFDPDVVVANAGAAQFTEDRPITMDAEDVVALCEATDARIVADHMDAINHCLLTRADLRAALEDAGCAERVAIPEDGETVGL